MNKLVAISAVAAVPTVAPAMGSGPSEAETLLADLTNQLIVAVAESRRLWGIVDDWDGERLYGKMPSVLRIQPNDVHFGHTPWEATDEFWHRPCDIVKWRCTEEWTTERIETDDGFEVKMRRILPSEELRTRAEEIVAAWEKWRRTKKEPRAYKAARRAFDNADRIEESLVNKILEIRATSLAGLISKARCAELYVFDREEFSSSIAADVLALSDRVAA